MSKTTPWPDDTDYEANPSANLPSADWLAEQEAAHDAGDQRDENFGQVNWAKRMLSAIVQEGAPPEESPSRATASRLEPCIRSFAAQVIGEHIDHVEHNIRVLKPLADVTRANNERRFTTNKSGPKRPPGWQDIAREYQQMLSDGAPKASAARALDRKHFNKTPKSASKRAETYDKWLVDA